MAVVLLLMGKQSFLIDFVGFFLVIIFFSCFFFVFICKISIQSVVFLFFPFLALNGELELVQSPPWNFG